MTSAPAAWVAAACGHERTARAGVHAVTRPALNAVADREVDGAYPTSADVRAIITYALDNGWSPELRGAGHVLSERAHAARFALPGFLLTDRLRTPDSGDPTLRVLEVHEAQRNG